MKGREGSHVVKRKEQGKFGDPGSLALAAWCHLLARQWATWGGGIYTQLPGGRDFLQKGALNL